MSRITPHLVAIAVVTAIVAVSAGASLRPSAAQAGEASGEAARPCAGRIAFSAGVPPQQDVYVVNADGSGLRRLTTSSAAEFDPSWSPDGRKIAYRRYGRDQSDQIFVMNADGTAKRNLTRRAGYDLSPSWSPDGRRIAFASSRAGTVHIWVINADGTRPRRITQEDGEYPDWSPDGTRIAFDRIFSQTERDIWVVNTDGSGARPLVAWRGSEEHGASWSPDGGWIAFYSDRGVSERDRQSHISRIWIARVDGSEARLLTTRPGDRPSWSPDGRCVLFTWGRLFIVRRDGTGLREIPVTVPGFTGLADWALAR